MEISAWLKLDLKKLRQSVNWPLLGFLVLFLNVKTPVKIVAIVLIYILHPDFRFGFKWKNSRLPLFYPIIMGIALLALLINADYRHPNYILLFCLGISCWPLALLAMHQMKRAVEHTDAEILHRTIIAFFIVNAVISAANLGYIMLQAHDINPYTFMGMHQRYYINTGDDIKGLSFDISSTNAALCAMGAFYFLDKRNLPMLVVCVATMLLTFSNLITMCFLFILVLLFIFRSDRLQKSFIVVVFGLYALSMAKISPQNGKYIDEITKYTLNKSQPPKVANALIADSLAAVHTVVSPLEVQRHKIARRYLDSLGHEISLRYKPETSPLILPKNVQHNDDGRIILPQPFKYSTDLYVLLDTTADRRQLLDFIQQNRQYLPLSTKVDYAPTLPGKATAAIQTYTFLKEHPKKILAGLGVGNFSSKIAFRATGAGIRGNYPHKHDYVSMFFMGNHLDLYLSFFSREAGFRSVKNNPYSVYDQMISEYGLLGFVAFAICYVWFFARNYKTLTYGLPVLAMMLALFFLDYWFEQLSVVVLFELLLFMNIKENTPKPVPDAA